MLTKDVIWTSIQRSLNVIDVKQRCILTKTLLTKDVIWTSIQRSLNVIDVKQRCVLKKNHVNTRRYFDVNSTFFERYRRQDNVVCSQLTSPNKDKTGLVICASLAPGLGRRISGYKTFLYYGSSVYITKLTGFFIFLFFFKVVYYLHMCLIL